MLSSAVNALRTAFNLGAKLQGPAMKAARLLPAAGQTSAKAAGASRMSATRLMDFLKSEKGLEALALYTPDALGAGMTMLYTPGDAGDKLIAGLAMGGGSALGGTAARKLLRGRGGTIGSIAADMVGGELGYLGGGYVQDSLLRAKGGGTTPYEKLALEDRRNLEQQILAQHGLAGYTIDDAFLMQNGLA